MRTNEATIRPIRQTYRGVTFRSTLEANWAWNLDRWHMPWCYEPMGYVVEVDAEPLRFLCDFYLPDTGIWLEVKGWHDKRIEAVRAMACALPARSGIVVGRPAERGMTRLDAAIPGQWVQTSKCKTCGRVGFRIFEGSEGDVGPLVAGAGRYRPCGAAGHLGLWVVDNLPFESVPW